MLKTFSKTNALCGKTEQEDCDCYPKTRQGYKVGTAGELCFQVF